MLCEAFVECALAGSMFFALSLVLTLMCQRFAKEGQVMRPKEESCAWHVNRGEFCMRWWTEIDV